MAHHLLLFYLSCLVSIAIRVSAEPCSTTGTFDDCCPSLDNKVIPVKGKEFRVYCNSFIKQEFKQTSTSVECIDNCSSDPACVGVHLKRPANARFTSCERKLQSPEANTVSFVLVDPTDTTQLTQDLNDCRRDLGNCQPGDPACTRNLQQCLRDLDNCKPGDPTCPGKLDTCLTDKRRCEGDLDRYKKQAKPFCCSDTKVQTIGGGSYRHHCNQVTTPASPNPFRTQHQAESIEECARICTKNSGCQWIYYVVSSKTCSLGRGGWKHQTKNAFTTPGATGKGCTVIEKA
ncbi:Ff.00g100560.m01.CDS01 [Fusarium sp. VM40]|nr:Ff.00g100560.m01.CDS01 [Fusarium sp. VM40]